MLIVKFIREEWGAAAAEYAVLIGCIALLISVVVSQIGHTFSTAFQTVADTIAGAH